MALTAVGEHHRQVHHDPARVVDTSALPQPGQSVAARAGQPGHLGDVGEEPGAGMTDHPAPVGTHDDLRTRSGSLHSTGAFLAG